MIVPSKAHGNTDTEAAILMIGSASVCRHNRRLQVHEDLPIGTRSLRTESQ
jgi:hypothetical protein